MDMVAGGSALEARIRTLVPALVHNWSSIASSVFARFCSFLSVIDGIPESSGMEVRTGI